jgi:hypothetical protein
MNGRFIVVVAVLRFRFQKVRPYSEYHLSRTFQTMDLLVMERSKNKNKNKTCTRAAGHPSLRQTI